MLKRILFLLFIFWVLPSKSDFVSAQTAFNENRYAEAFKNFLPEAEKGDSISQYYIGYMYIYGLGIDKNADLGLQYLNQSAEKYAPAQTLLGYLYDEGRVLPMDKAKAVNFYKEAAKNNSTFAQLNLGLAYYKGEGVMKNDAQAIQLLSKVPLDQHPIAGRFLGEIYLSNATENDNYQKAVQAYSGSAKYGDIPSFYALGQIFSRNDSGFADFSRAIKFYTYAASKEYEPAQYLLGTMYVNEELGSGNLYLGRAWLQMAANKNYQPAISALNQLDSSMTLSEKEAANKELIRLQREIINQLESPFIEEQRQKEEAMAAQASAVAQRPVRRRRH